MCRIAERRERGVVDLCDGRVPDLEYTGVILM
jgi:hypothetical protein